MSEITESRTGNQIILGSTNTQELLEPCRRATKDDEHKEAWNTLIQNLPSDDMDHCQSILHSILLEFPYDSSVYSSYIDTVCESVGMEVVVSVCVAILQSMSTSQTASDTTNTKRLPAPALIQTSAALVQQQIKQQNLSEPLPESIVPVLLRFPSILANACLAHRLILPFTPTEYSAQLLAAKPHSWSLLQSMCHQKEVVQSGLKDHHPLLTIGEWTWVPRDVVHLLVAFLDPSYDNGTPNVMESCCCLWRSQTEPDRVLHHILTGNRSSTLPVKSLVAIWKDCQWLQAAVEILADVWSPWTFPQDVSLPQQQFITSLLLEGLDGYNDLDETDPSLLTLLQGVTHRLESTIQSIRLDGMRVAKQLARLLRQEISFEELDQWNEEAETPITDRVLLEAPSDLPQRKTVKMRDADAEYDSDDSSHEEQDDDASTILGEDWVPYSLEDDEEDLAETSKPMHLLRALELLRTSEQDEHACSHHTTALESLPWLIRQQPDDLPDTAVSILLQVLRMENKFSIKDFVTKRQEVMVSLAVHEPIPVGQQLISEAFGDYGLVDRLACFEALQVAACELSGFLSLDQGKKVKDTKELNTAALEPVQLDVTVSAQVKRIQSKTRYKRSPRVSPTLVRNNFTPIAPLWFYSLLGKFVSLRENESLWSGSIGSQVLATVLRTLATFVEFAGIACGPVLAKDLLEVSWSLLDVDVTDVRISVLLALASSVAVLPREKILTMIMDKDSSFMRRVARLGQGDPNEMCRQIAHSIHLALAEVVQDVPNTLM